MWRRSGEARASRIPHPASAAAAPCASEPGGARTPPPPPPRVCVCRGGRSPVRPGSGQEELGITFPSGVREECRLPAPWLQRARVGFTPCRCPLLWHARVPPGDRGAGETPYGWVASGWRLRSS
ncbi:unnamed protein product [Coccothraustes coccothraustes]